MWLFTKFGFFSVTSVRRRVGLRYPAGTLQVRARVWEDLENLRDNYLPKLSETIHMPGRDYPYRGYIDRKHLAKAMGKIVMDITYSNFKDEVKKEQGPDRASLYMGVWSTMFEAERKIEQKHEQRTYQAPMLPFEKRAEEYVAIEEEESLLDRQLRETLMEKEAEDEVRLAEMRETNTHGHTVDWYENCYDYEDNGNLEGLTIVSEEDIINSEDFYKYDAFEEFPTDRMPVFSEPPRHHKKKSKKKRRRYNRD